MACVNTNILLNDNYTVYTHKGETDTGTHEGSGNYPSPPEISGKPN